MIFIGGLAVYKLIHLVTLAVPKDIPLWVRVTAEVVLGILVASLLSGKFLLFEGLAVATLAGTTHAVLRLVTLAGDLSLKRSLK